MQRGASGLPGTPSDHMDALLRFLVLTAKRQVDEQGGFHPFGASMAPDGELRMLDAGGGDGRGEVEALRVDARSQAASLLAVGICTDVTLPGTRFPEAIRVELEHRDGAPSTCVVAYRNTDDELTFAPEQRLPGERRVWPA